MRRHWDQRILDKANGQYHQYPNHIPGSKLEQKFYGGQNLRKTRKRKKKSTALPRKEEAFHSFRDHN